MKTLWSSIVVGLAAGLFFTAVEARADLEVSASVQIHGRADFEAPLAPHGAWIEVGSYGRCWHPGHVAVGWRPYCEGEWVWTEAGWYWESDEPWGWACYHYGSWVYDSGAGWVWVPDIEWAPAWVTWRYGGGYVGWAPCGPRGVAVGVVVGGPAFVFVESRHFHERVRSTTVVVNDNRIIAKTTVINSGVRVENKSFDGGGPRKVNFNEGPPLAEVQKATANKVRTVKIREAVDRTPAPHLNRAGGEGKDAPKPGGPPLEPPKVQHEAEHLPVPGPAPAPPKPNLPDNDKLPPQHDVAPPVQHVPKERPLPKERPQVDRPVAPRQSEPPREKGEDHGPRHD